MRVPIELLMYSRYSQDTIAKALGAADYSYYFVLQRFRTLLESDFSITVLPELATLISAVQASQSAGRFPILLCFTPPHDIPVAAPCPIIPVFAWEFDTLPDISWNGDIRNNWAEMLRQCPAAITHSLHTVNVVKQRLGQDYTIISAPASVWDSYSAIEEKGWNNSTRLIEAPEGHLDTSMPSWADVALSEFTGTQIPMTGCVFTSILNPHDGRKNIHDIISAFVDACRDYRDACLLLKFTNASSFHFLEEARAFLRRLTPFCCRIVILTGYLPATSFHDLVRSTTFCVNASTGEGQCLPMMEFMSAGKPAISPAHTAMAEYVDVGNAFIVKASPEPASWPQDSRQMLTCKRMRVSWQSLYEAYTAAYKTATCDLERYRRMSEAAEQRLYQHNAACLLRPRIAQLLQAVAAQARLPRSGVAEGDCIA